MRRFVAALLLVGLPIMLLFAFLCAMQALQADFAQQPQDGKDSHASESVDLGLRVTTESACWRKAFSSNGGAVPDCSARRNSVQRDAAPANFTGWSIQGVAHHFGLDRLLPESVKAKASTNMAKSPFVAVLEWLILTCAIVQAYLIVLSHGCPHWVARWPNETFYLSDWALNSPPIFGVLVNLYAFAEMLSHNVSSLNGDFLHFFGEAVVTTILGGMVYVQNLFLRVFIKFPKE